MKAAEIQRIMLETIANPGSDTRLGRGRHYLAAEVSARCPPDDQPKQYQVQEAIWSLVGRGLAYIDIDQPAPENWSLRPTAAGAAVLDDRTANPDDPENYLIALFSKVPNLSDEARRYAKEALSCYFHGDYLAATVMLGVSTEAVFLDAARSFVPYLNNESGRRLATVLDSERNGFLKKFSEFRKRLMPEKGNLPPELADGLDIQVSAALDLLRVARNDAGHPKQAQVGRDDCFVNLRIFPRMAARMYTLKEFFEKSQAP